MRALPRLARLALVLLLPSALAACQGSGSVPCQTTKGDVVIYAAAGWKAFVDSGCPVVRGNLLISAGIVEPIANPAVAEVTGQLAVTYNAQLQGLALPNLKTIGGSLLVAENGALAEFSLPTLTSVGGWVDVSFNTGIGRVDLPVLATEGGDILIAGNTGLATVNLPALGAVRGDLHVLANDGLEALDLPSVAYVRYELWVTDNRGLKTLSLPALAWTLAFMVTSNPVLPECQPLAIKDRLIAAGGLEEGSWRIYLNDAAGTCGP